MDYSNVVDPEDFQCNGYVSTNTLLLLLSMVSTGLLLLGSFWKKRKRLCQSVCMSRPGMLQPLDILDDNKGYRLCYAMAFGMTAPICVSIFDGDSLPEAFADIDPQLQDILQIISTMIYGTALYPVFSALLERHVVSYVIALLLVGTLFSMEISNVVNCSLSVNMTAMSPSLAAEYAFYMTIGASRTVPLLICELVLLGLISWLLIAALKQHCNLSNSLEMKQSFCNSTHYIYVKELFSSKKPTNSKRGLISTIRKKFLYRSVKGYHYPMLVLSTFWVAFVLLYMINIDIVQQSIIQLDHGDEYLIKLQSYKTENDSSNNNTLNPELDNTTSLESIDEYLSSPITPTVSESTTMTDDNDTLIDQFTNDTSNPFDLSFPSDDDDDDDDFMRMFNAIVADNYYDTIFTTFDLFKKCAFVSEILAVLSTLVIMATAIKAHRDDTLALYRGDFSKIPPSKAVPNRSLIMSSLEFSGFQVAYILWGFIVHLVLLTLLTFVVGIVLVFSEIFDIVVNYFARKWISFLLGFVIFGFQFLLGRYVFLQQGQLALNNRRFYSNLLYFMYFYNIFLGFFSCLFRIAKSFLVGVVFLSRLDRSMLPRQLELDDPGFQAYVGFLHVQNAHNNPILRVFCQLLQQSVLGPNAPETSNIGPMGDEFIDIISKKNTRWIKVRNRFQVWIMLSKHPELITIRKQYLQKKQEARAAPLELNGPTKPQETVLQRLEKFIHKFVDKMDP